MVNEFNKNNVSVFLILLKAGGTGLNLTGAYIVIHYDPWWNLSAENQASDRVYRIVQRNNIQIYKLIVKDTIEEKICKLQQKKDDLLEAAVGVEEDIINFEFQISRNDDQCHHFQKDKDLDLCRRINRLFYV